VYLLSVLAASLLEHKVVETEDGKSKAILTRPRDQIAAVRALQKIPGAASFPKGILFCNRTTIHHPRRLYLSLGSASRGWRLPRQMGPLL